MSNDKSVLNIGVSVRDRNVNTGWKHKLVWRWILEEKNINPADCILIYDVCPCPMVYSIWNTKYCRVEYVYAEMSRSNSAGETTKINQQLAAAVRDRGMPGDHCGHIVGAQLGGRMNFYNLIPQNGYINRGFNGDLRMYWSDIDQCIAHVLKESNGAKVEIQYAPIYDNSISTTRPVEINVLRRETVPDTRVRLEEYIAPNSEEMMEIQRRGTDTRHNIVHDWQSSQCNNKDLKKYKRFDADNLGKEFDSYGKKK